MQVQGYGTACNGSELAPQDKTCQLQTTLSRAIRVDHSQSEDESFTMARHSPAGCE